MWFSSTQFELYLIVTVCGNLCYIVVAFFPDTNRTGDIMTIGGNRLVLFLSFCRINDLDTALNHILPLPTGDIFSNRMVWFEDDQISAELVQMRLLAPEQWGMPLPLTQSSKPVINAEHDGRHWRRIPEPMRLLDDAVERSS